MVSATTETKVGCSNAPNKQTNIYLNFILERVDSYTLKRPRNSSSTTVSPRFPMKRVLQGGLSFMFCKSKLEGSINNLIFQNLEQCERVKNEDRLGQLFYSSTAAHFSFIPCGIWSIHQVSNDLDFEFHMPTRLAFTRDMPSQNHLQRSIV